MISPSKSIPSSFGKLTSILFDEYTLYKCDITSGIIDNYLPDKLSSFASISLKNVAKRDFFYSKPILFASRSQLTGQFTNLSSSITIEDLFQSLFSRTNNIDRYNFILTSNSLSFIRIPHTRHLTYHLLAKHITLANRSQDVRFAGEFWRDENNIFTLNNNSGTYRPTNDLIEKTVQLFNELTPNLHFQGISFQTSQRPSFKSRFIYKIKNKFPIQS